MPDANYRILIIGGGMAGHKLAYDLQDVADVTLIDPKDFFEVPMAAPRLMVERDALSSIIPFRGFLGRVKLIRGVANKVTVGHVTIEEFGSSTPRMLPFDILVIASGASYGSSLFRPTSGGADERREHYRGIQGKIAQAQRILVVGGGAIGVETAGELIEDFPGKSVTLLDAAPDILGRMSPTLRQWARDHLEKRGVRLVLGSRLQVPALPATGIIDIPGVARTERGEDIPFDLALFATGIKPNSIFMLPHFSNALNAQGEIKVSPTFLVDQTTNIFALGDVTDLPEKGGLWVQFQVPIVLANIRKILSGKKPSEFKSYKRKLSPTSTIVTLGRKSGVIDLPFGKTRWGWLARTIKAKDMLVKRYRKGIGLA